MEQVNPGKKEPGISMHMHYALVIIMIMIITKVLI